MSKEKKEEEELNVDFGKIKDKIKSIFKGNKKHHKEHTDKELSHKAQEETTDKKTGPKHKADEDDADETLAIDYKHIANFSKKYGFIFLILIAIFLSIFMRIQPAYLPITDIWAQDAVYNAVRTQIRGQIDQQYPNLPDENKNTIVEKEFQSVLKEQGPAIDAQITQTSEYFKSQAKDISGNNYLNDIDTWVWYYYTKKLVDHGKLGNTIKNGKEWDSTVLAPLGSEVGNPGFHVYLEYYSYKLVHFFNKDISLMTVIFFLPLLLCALCIIPAFFIVKKKAGNFGGFITALFIAITPAFLGRTSAGTVDTDPYNVLFPLYIAWFFLEAIEAKDLKKKIILGVLSSATLAVYSFAWIGWWFLFDFLIGLNLAYLAYLIINEIYTKKGFSLEHLIKDSKIKNTAILFIIFFITTIVLSSLISGYNTAPSIWNGPLSFIKFKHVGVDNIWPNVFTTVAEQNESSLSATVQQLGGNLLFLIAILGIIFLIFKKDEHGHYDVPYAILLTVWFVATTYASVKGIRYILLFAPAFAIALGIAFGLIYQYLTKIAVKDLNFNEVIAKIIIILLLFMLLLFPRNIFTESYSASVHQFPLMNDAWYDSLTKIKEGTPDNTIITSWWDYGHWFRAIADRPITFDGGTQNTPMAHWVGRALLTSDEDEAVAILRMLDCGSSLGQKKLEEFMENDSLASIELTKKIIMQSKDNAKKELLKNGITDSEAEEVLALTHCTPPDAIFITSDDMIGKSGVWAHFGSWNFTKSDILNKVHDMDIEQAKIYMKERYNYTNEEASSMYYKVKSVGVQEQANTWVAPWPSYASSKMGCLKTGDDTITCSNNLMINLTAEEAYFETANGKLYPQTFTYVKGKDVVTKTYNESIFASNGRLLGLTLIPEGPDSYSIIFTDPELSGSMFNRLYYLQGHGLKHFDFFDEEKAFNGNRVVVWKVDWEGKDKIDAYSPADTTGSVTEVEI